ncbi:unnamed protein product [Brugia timori]|uniref:Secreted protein n=1 Tax=Brugia timori TaxID=42155 RepID=A0A0R3RB83_9BILA|nr:unnamed protein product [Brugia timori]
MHTPSPNVRIRILSSCVIVFPFSNHRISGSGSPLTLHFNVNASPSSFIFIFCIFSMNFGIFDISSFAKFSSLTITTLHLVSALPPSLIARQRYSPCCSI